MKHYIENSAFLKEIDTLKSAGYNNLNYETYTFFNQDFSEYVERLD